jgi:P27 family predicted phage terminase small subunit
MPSPHPKPTLVKKNQGNPGKRALNDKEPFPKAGTPKMPVWLTPKAKTAWAEVSRILKDMGVGTVADGKALELLCATYAEWRDANQKLKEYGGLTYECTTKDGGTMHRAYPEVAIRADSARRLQSLLSEFGLTPSSRSKIKADVPGEVDEMEALLGGKRA